ncbi:MAG: hypothetical protein G01um10143_568 [Parcubacteria group bacterium Gr01-1014_3]|nr:MAG: hypothetical protein G01um10143_568 [Parcubacteria group bacterium Gr01-1014_3]
MNTENQNLEKKNSLLPASILASAIILAAALVYNVGWRIRSEAYLSPPAAASNTTADETVLPVRWGDLGKQLVAAGVIDADRFEQLYFSSGGLTQDIRAMLYGDNNGTIRINAENSGVMLNLFWALGLGNKNPILETGPMSSWRYGGAGKFASTAGWTIARGEAMDHYSAHPMIMLTPEQQILVERVSKNIYRPCCKNPAYFPDCNHGMAMLGLLELLASRGTSEEEMRRIALKVNNYWFPEQSLGGGCGIETAAVQSQKSGSCGI